MSETKFNNLACLVPTKDTNAVSSTRWAHGPLNKDSRAWTVVGLPYTPVHWRRSSLAACDTRLGADA